MSVDHNKKVLSFLFITILIGMTFITTFNVSAVEGDEDNDHMEDEWEEFFGLDPRDPSDADEDPDGDGVVNWEENSKRTDPTDPSSHPHDVNEENYDPSSETPTDTSILIEITEAESSLIENGDKVNVITMVKGTTNGVDHCIFTQITTLAGGSKEEFSDWEEEFSWDKYPWYEDWMPKVGYNSWHFKETSDDWATWEYKVSITMNITDFWYTEFMKMNPTKVLFYVRAFDDVADTKWNQASKEVTIKTGEGDPDKSKNDDDGSIPGFDPVFVIVSFGFALVITTIRRGRY
jgi:hypothetical protein